MVKFHVSCTHVNQIALTLWFMCFLLVSTGRLWSTQSQLAGEKRCQNFSSPKFSLDNTTNYPPHPPHTPKIWAFDTLTVLDSWTLWNNRETTTTEAPPPPQYRTLRFWQFWTEEQNLPNPRLHLRKLLQRLYCVRRLPSRCLFDGIPKTRECGVQKVLGSKIMGTVHAFPECSQDHIYVRKRNIINISVSRNNKYQSECRKLVVVTFTQVLLWSDRWALRQLVRSTRNETTENKRFPKEQNRQQISGGTRTNSYTSPREM